MRGEITLAVAEHNDVLIKVSRVDGRLRQEAKKSYLKTYIESYGILLYFPEDDQTLRRLDQGLLFPFFTQL